MTNLTTPKSFTPVKVNPELAKSGPTIIPRIEIMQSSSTAVKKKLIDMGVFGKVSSGSKEPVSLGDSLVCLVCSMRFKAMRFGEDMRIDYDESSEHSKSIIERADEGGQNNPCLYGYEVLVWHCATEEFLTFHLKGKSLSRETDVFAAIFNKQVAEQTWIPVRINCEFVENQLGSWYTVKCSPYPNDPETTPDPTQLDVITDDFNNAKPYSKSDASVDVNVDSGRTV